MISIEILLSFISAFSLVLAVFLPKNKQAIVSLCFAIFIAFLGGCVYCGAASELIAHSSAYPALNILIYITGILCLIFTYYENRLNANHSFECYNLISFITISTSAIIAGIGNLVHLYVLLEWQAISSAILLASSSNTKSSSESGIKYIISGSLASIFILLGMAMIYLAQGNLQISSVDLEKPMHIVGYVLILCGLFVKSGIFPFHVWVADVYSGVKISYINVVNTLPKISLVYAVYYIFSVANFSVKVHDSLIVLLAISTACAAIRCVSQFDIKRIIAYSGAVNFGIITLYILVCHTKLDIRYGMFYFLTGYILANCLLSSTCLQIFQRNDKLSIKNPLPHGRLLSIFLVIAMSSLLGMPPMVGFFAKILLASHILIIKTVANIAVVMVIFLTTLLGSYYYFNIPASLIKLQSDGGIVSRNSIPMMAISALLAGVILFGFAIL